MNLLQEKPKIRHQKKKKTKKDRGKKFGQRKQQA